MSWHLATTRADGATQPVAEPDPRDTPLEFHLTPQEQHAAAQARQQIASRLRHLNRHDTARPRALEHTP